MRTISIKQLLKLPNYRSKFKIKSWYAVCNQIEGLSFKFAYDCLFNPLYDNVYHKQPNKIKSPIGNVDIN
jgi:hypothetical protein